MPQPYPKEFRGEARTWLLRTGELHRQLRHGTTAYVEQKLLDHPDQDPAQLAGEAQLAIFESVGWFGGVASPVAWSQQWR